MDLTDKQLDTLRHMLGINTPHAKVPRPYRNYAAVPPGDSEFVGLEQMGAVERYDTCDSTTKYYWYECTEAGRLAAIRSHKKIRHSRAKRKYMAYLSISDVCPDLTFKEFLTDPEFKESRDNA